MASKEFFKENSLLIILSLLVSASEMKIGDLFAEWGSGAGQIDPTKALDPGLIYDLSEIDYIRFLCKASYSGTILSICCKKLIYKEQTNVYELKKRTKNKEQRLYS